MSASLHPQDTVPAAIAPHLLHSPVNSPAIVDLHGFIGSYHDNSPDSPQSLGYPPSPEENTAEFTHPEAQPEFTKAIASPNGMLIVYSYSPASAPPGAALNAYVDFTNLSGTNVHLRVVFGDLALPTSVSPNVPPQERPPGQERGEWRLRISVPFVGQASTQMAKTGQDGRLEWPLTVQALDSGGNLLDTIGFGVFAYESERTVHQFGSSRVPRYHIAMYPYREFDSFTVHKDRCFLTQRGPKMPTHMHVCLLIPLVRLSRCPHAAQDIVSNHVRFQD